MSVVLDANTLVVLSLDRQRAPAVEKLLRAWKTEEQELHAPVLLRYEIASALAQAVSAGQLDAICPPATNAKRFVLTSVGASDPSLPRSLRPGRGFSPELGPRR